MADRCMKCGTELPVPLPETCPNCQRMVNLELDGITATPSVQPPTTFAEGASPSARPSEPELETEAPPSIAKGGPRGRTCPPPLLVVLSVILCGAQGIKMNLDGARRFSVENEETIIFAVVGLVVGLALAVDHWFFRKKLNEPALAPADDAPEANRTVAPPSDWLPIAMIILPIVSAVLAWFAAPLRLTQMHLSLIGSGAIIATSALGYFSIRQMALRMDRKSTYHGAMSSPAYMYLAMLAFWPICYPVHFFARKNMGGRNLIVPGLLATVASLLPLSQPFVGEPELPGADDPEVLMLIRQMIEDEPTQKPATVRDGVEVSFDVGKQVRVGRCLASTRLGEERVSYKIDWQNRQKGIWQVALLDRLPLVNAPEVKELIGRVLDDQWVRFGGRLDLRPIAVLQPIETGYDPAKQERRGRANVSTGKGVVEITFAITWADAERKNFNVQVQGAPP